MSAPAGERERVVEVRGVVSRFGRQVVHDGLDLDVYRGEVLGVIGGSGAGKSVLLRTIVGLRQPQGGTIRMFGIDTTHMDDAARRPIERRFGLLFQDGALFSSLTVLENVRVPLIEYYRLPDDVVDDLAMLKIRLAGLPSSAAHKYPSALSGGMRKRAGLARAIALDPPLVFFDEPSAGLDPIMAAGLDQLILDLRRLLGLTFVIVTHELDSIREVADRILMLDRGKVIFTGTLDDAETTDVARVRQLFERRPDEFIAQRNV